MITYVILSIEALPVSQAKLSELREETCKYMVLTILKDTILNGLPENKKQFESLNFGTLETK